MTTTKYYDLLHKRKQAKRLLNEAIRIEKRKLNQELRNVNHKWFLAFDIAVILLILFNVGALVITNMLVVKENPNKEFYEANPVQCKNNGFACHSDATRLIFMFFKQVLIYTLLIGLYLYHRYHVVDNFGMMVLGGIVLFYFVTLGIDFFNDLGYLLGVLTYGKLG